VGFLRLSRTALAPSAEAGVREGPEEPGRHDRQVEGRPVADPRPCPVCQRPVAGRGIRDHMPRMITWRAVGTYDPFCMTSSDLLPSGGFHCHHRTARDHQRGASLSDSRVCSVWVVMASAAPPTVTGGRRADNVPGLPLPGSSVVAKGSR